MLGYLPRSEYPNGYADPPHEIIDWNETVTTLSIIKRYLNLRREIRASYRDAQTAANAIMDRREEAKRDRKRVPKQGDLVLERYTKFDTDRLNKLAPRWSTPQKVVR